MRKLASLLSLILLTASGISAMETDWGGKFEDITQGSNIEDDTFTQGNKIQMWMRGEVNPLFNFYARGGYTYRYEGEDHKFIPNLSDLYVYGKSDLEEGKSLGYTAGRFKFNDMTTRVVRSSADGLELKYQNRVMPVRFGIGYTGLVFNESSEVVVSPADKIEKGDEFLLAPPRILGYAEFRYPNILGSQSMTLAVIAQQDLRADDDTYLEDSGTGKLHSQYFELGADGQIMSGLYYSVTGVLQTGQYLVPAYDPVPSADYTYLGGMASFTLDYYLESRYTTAVSLEALYSTGDKWSNRGDFQGLLLPGDSHLNRFTPISNSTKGFVYTPQVGNLIYGDLGVSVKPIETLQLKLSGITFFRAVDGPISDETIIEDSGDSLYLGQEFDFVVNYRPFSDLGLALTTGIFIPNDEIQADSDIRFRIGGYMSVSF